MKPYYQDDYVTLFHGDCREVVPTLGRFDLLLTDPPYGIDYGRAGGFSASHGWSQNRENVGWDACRVSSDIMLATMEVCDTQIIWGGNYYTDILPPSMRWLVWDKVQRGFSLADCEMAWTNQNRASRVFTYARGNESGFAPGLRHGDKGFCNTHPTQKPLALMEWCISIADKSTGAPVQTILDPFAGSGTTGRAAKDLGRKCVLVEREERYCEIAAKRMAQEVLGLEMPAAVAVPENVEDLWAN